MRTYTYLFLILAAVLAGGCQHDVHIRTLGPGDAYAESFLRAEGLSIESNGQRRVVLRPSELREEAYGESTGILMYLSVPVDPIHGVDLHNPKVFVVWSDIAAEFSGLLKATALSWKRIGASERLNGTFTGTLRTEEIPESSRDVRITINEATVHVTDSPHEFDRQGYTEMLREHLYRVEFDAEDREYWRANPAPGGEVPGEND